MQETCSIIGALWRAEFMSKTLSFSMR